MKDIPNTIFDCVDDAFGATTSNQNKWFEFMLRNKVVPPIKGEITKGKVRWRGLSLVHYPLESELTGADAFTSIDFIVIEQRGLPLKWTAEEFEEWKTKNQVL